MLIFLRSCLYLYMLVFIFAQTENYIDTHTNIYTYMYKSVCAQLVVKRRKKLGKYVKIEINENCQERKNKNVL